MSYICLTKTGIRKLHIMHMETRSVEPKRPSIKERLLLRFGEARKQVGPGWRERLAGHDSFFNTREGEAYMRSVAQAYSNSSRGHVDRIERVTLALEKLAGIKSREI